MALAAAPSSSTGRALFGLRSRLCRSQHGLPTAMAERRRYGRRGCRGSSKAPRTRGRTARVARGHVPACRSRPLPPGPRHALNRALSTNPLGHAFSSGGHAFAEGRGAHTGAMNAEYAAMDESIPESDGWDVDDGEQFDARSMFAGRTDVNEALEKMVVLRKNNQIQEAESVFLDWLGSAHIDLRNKTDRAGLLKMFNEVIRSFAHNGDTTSAVRWFDAIENAQGIKPNARSYNGVIRAFSHVPDPDGVWRWIGRMREAGFNPDGHSFKAMIIALGKRNRVSEASKLFEEFRQRQGSNDKVHVGIWIAIVLAHMKTGHMEGMMRWLTEMVEVAGLRPPQALCVDALRTLADNHRYSEVMECMGLFISSGLMPNAHCFDIVVHSLLRSGQDPQVWWDQMAEAGVEADELSFNTLILHYARAGQWDLVDRWFAEMLDTLEAPPSSVILRSVLHGCSENGDLEKASQWYERLVGRHGVRPDAGSLSSLARLFGTAGDVTGALHWFEEMSRFGVAPEVESFNALLQGVIRRDIRGAHEVIEAMVRAEVPPDVTSFNLIIRAHCKLGSVQEAAEWVSQLPSFGVEPDEYTYAHMVKASVDAGDTATAQTWIDQMHAAGIGHCSVYNIMMDHYGRKRNIQAMTGQYFNMTKKRVQPNAVTFGVLIKHCGVTGDLARVKKWLDNMKRQRVVATVEIFNSLINIWHRAGQLEGALDWYKQMLDQGLHPDAHTYSVLLDAIASHSDDLSLLQSIWKRAQASRVKLNFFSLRAAMKGHKRLASCEQTETFFASIKSQKDPGVWNMMLSTYVQHGLMDKAREMLLVEMRKGNVRRDAISFKILMDGYGRLRRLDECESILKNMRQVGLSLTEQGYGTAVYWFSRGERRHLDTAMALLKEQVELGLGVDQRGYQHCYRALQRLQAPAEEVAQFKATMAGLGISARTGNDSSPRNQRRRQRTTGRRRQ